MTNKSPIIKRLKTAATKAAARASAAKNEVRAAKARLKQARKLFKAEKKAAKQARRKVNAAAAKRARKPRPAANLKLKRAIRKSAADLAAKTKSAPRAKSASKAKVAAKTNVAAKKAGAPQAVKPRVPKKKPETMRSAADVAKSVIERLHAPPPALPPEPKIAAVPDSPEAAASSKP
jgi:hypothetical protein